MQRIADARFCDHASGLLSNAEWTVGEGRSLGEAALAMARELAPTCHASEGDEWVSSLARTARGAERALEEVAAADPDDDHAAQLHATARVLAERLAHRAGGAQIRDDTDL